MTYTVHSPEEELVVWFEVRLQEVLQHKVKLFAEDMESAVSAAIRQVDGLDVDSVERIDVRVVGVDVEEAG
jgi:hypothetical protein